MSVSTGTPCDPETVLWYEAPASAWEEALPLGNGRLGMMPYGDVAMEHVILNDITLWSGSEADYANPDAAESLEVIRGLLLQGKNAQAQDVAPGRTSGRTRQVRKRRRHCAFPEPRRRRRRTGRTVRRLKAIHSSREHRHLPRGEGEL